MALEIKNIIMRFFNRKLCQGLRINYNNEYLEVEKSICNNNNNILELEFAMCKLIRNGKLFIKINDYNNFIQNNSEYNEIPEFVDSNCDRNNFVTEYIPSEYQVVETIKIKMTSYNSEDFKSINRIYGYSEKLSCRIKRLMVLFQ